MHVWFIRDWWALFGNIEPFVYHSKESGRGSDSPVLSETAGSQTGVREKGKATTTQNC